MPHTKNLEAWSLSEADFPVNGDLQEKLEFCLRYAILAPSPYNTQPWFFTVDNDTISVYCDRRYSLSVADPDDRQMMMSVASALFNLRLALRNFGFEENTQLLPNPAEEDLIARIQVRQGGRAMHEEHKPLFHAITSRRHNRRPFKRKDVEAEKIALLKKAAEAEGAWLHICEGDERDVVAHMIAEGDRIQMSRPHFRREMAAWANARRFLSGDGFPGYARPTSMFMDMTIPPIFRRFESQPGVVASDENILAGCPVLAILGCEKGGLIDRLYAGQGYMRVLLQIEALGLSVSTLSQPCEVADLRLRLHDEIQRVNGGRAYYILRIGYGDKGVNFSPRRPLETFIETDADMMSSSSSSAVRTKKHKSRNLFAVLKRLFSGSGKTSR